jgi:hypothetical protein
MTDAAERTPPRLMWSIREAAARIGVCETTIKAAIRRGDLKSARIGTRANGAAGRRLIEDAALRAWLALGSEGASTQ